MRSCTDMFLLEGALCLQDINETKELPPIALLRAGTQLKLPRLRTCEITRYTVSESEIELWTHDNTWVEHLKLRELQPEVRLKIVERLGLGLRHFD